MITLLPSHFVLEEVTAYDLVIASVAWGFTLGIGWLTTWTAMKQTRQIYRRHRLGIFRNAYVWMIWGEISVCLAFGIICFMYLLAAIPPSFAFYFCILTTWALQVQFLLQIIINRCSILLTDKVHAWRIKVGVATLITAINISVYCIWIPARLQISERYIEVNEWWDRCEKIIYLIVDAALNIYFIRIVQRNLVEHGLRKYRNLVRFNIFIIGFSLSMDVLIISMMSLKNTFVYMQFHPLAYIVKLNIEMSMAELIAKIAKSQDKQGQSDGYSYSRSHGTQRNLTVDDPVQLEDGRDRKGRAWATVTTTVEMHSMKAPAGGDKAQAVFNHSDTDVLINPATPYVGQLGCTQGDSRGGSYTGGGGSLSSYDSTNEGAVAERTEGERGRELP